MTWKLKRTVQCAKCPWIKGIDTHDIPNGYTVEKHLALHSTIADRGDPLASLDRDQHVMACHELEDAHCIGWLVNQVGVGNNIAMRLRMRDCDNAEMIRLHGEQHACFEDTLPPAAIEAGD